MLKRDVYRMMCVLHGKNKRSITVKNEKMNEEVSKERSANRDMEKTGRRDKINTFRIKTDRPGEKTEKGRERERYQTIRVVVEGKTSGNHDQYLMMVGSKKPNKSVLWTELNDPQ
ncbi:hypothetical protein DPMN_169686 [Dreissena polymorpha]|uniref:Uncharacterized protein n=1 Tax=Dreissena polymorpha TaxID=45954 RepID=A0A9D4DVZ8_DREPO|nr:hypothetical protein DPMN_169686 [Dreissena polymorpha]